jgi:hypothetical protein
MILGSPQRVARVSPRGTVYWALEHSLPRLPDDYIDCCVYLYPSAADAEAGSKIGGSGFLFGVATKDLPNAHFLYAVSNRHVIEGGSTVVRLNTRDGKTDIIELTELDWINHPSGDDLAIAALPPLADLHKFSFLDDGHLLSKELVDQYNVGPGDDVFVAGRFVNQEGKQQNTPSVRFGNLAQMPPMPVSQRRGAGVFEQESFIVEARSIGGFSGAPVFLALSSHFIRPNRPNPGELNRVFLMGIDWGYINDWDTVNDEVGRPLQNLRVRTNTGMMAVVPAWKLKEMVDMPKFTADRAASEERILKKQSETIGVVTSSQIAAAPPATGDNSTHREDFMRLVGAAAQRREPED